MWGIPDVLARSDVTRTRFQLPVGFAPKPKQLLGPGEHQMVWSHYDIIQLSSLGSDVRLISHLSLGSPQNRSTNRAPQALSVTSFSSQGGA